MSNIDVTNLSAEELLKLKAAIAEQEKLKRKDLFTVGDEVRLKKGKKPYRYCGTVVVLDEKDNEKEMGFVQAMDKDSTDKRKTSLRDFSEINTLSEM